MRAYIELFFATVLWGFGFIAAVWALEGMGPLWQTSLRFVIAFVMLDLATRLKLLGDGAVRYSWNEFRKVALPGVCLFGLIAFQTWGLRYTTATKSGFITVLYVLFVPVFERIFFHVRARGMLWLWIAVALLGVALICGAISEAGISSHFFSAFNLGDVLCAICAVFAAGHILAVSRSGKSFESPLRFHLYQCLWVGGLAASTGTIFEGMDWIFRPWSLKVWLGLLELGILSSGIAFLLQVRVQRVIPPSTASLLLLMESPWAMFFSVILGLEVLTNAQMIGAGLILVAAAAESYGASKTDSAKIE